MEKEESVYSQVKFMEARAISSEKAVSQNDFDIILGYFKEIKRQNFRLFWRKFPVGLRGSPKTEQINELKNKLTQGRAALKDLEDKVKKVKKGKLKPSALKADFGILVKSYQDSISILGRRMKGGFFSINQFIDHLIDDLLSNRIFLELISVRILKNRLELLILEKKFITEEFSNIKEKYLNSKEENLWRSFSIYLPRVERIVKISKRILERKSLGEDKRKQIQAIIDILEKINWGDVFNSFLEYSKLESKALKSREYFYFLKLLQREKAESFEIKGNLEDLGMVFDFEEIVRAGFEEESENFIETLVKKEFAKLVKKYSNKFLRLLFMFSLPLAVYKRHKKIEGEKNSREYYENDLPTPIEIKEAENLRKIYGISIVGNYSNTEIGILTEVLHRYHKEELNRFLRGIHFGLLMGDDPNWDGRYDSVGKVLYISTKSRDRIKLILEHEIAHARSYMLPKERIVAFQRINEKYGLTKKKLKIEQEKLFRKHSEDSRYLMVLEFDASDDYVYGAGSYGAFGYGDVYGLKNFEEDIATMQEMVISSEKKIMPWNQEMRTRYKILWICFITFSKTYKEKARHLKEFGFITKKEFNRFVDRLNEELSKIEAESINLDQLIEEFKLGDIILKCRGYKTASEIVF